MLNIMWFLIIFMSGQSSNASKPTTRVQNWRQVWQQQILQAQDSHQLQGLIEKQKQAEVLSAACDLQLARQQVPFACYELQALVPTQEEKLTHEVLEQACLRAADSFQDVQLDDHYIESTKCHNKLSQKILLNRYKNGL